MMKIQGGLRQVVLCTVMLAALFLAGCSSSTRRPSARAWSDLKTNSRAAAKATGGVIISISELSHLGVKSFVEWLTEARIDRDDVDDLHATLSTPGDLSWDFRQVVSGY